ncbi:MAG: bifunctional phosphopantothenoylcysteine decarboxylase/phosphopantothenate--cysteine ligase CoaBC [Actinomycetota bacterium]
MAGAPITFPRGREVVLGVSAGIAAYKSCELLRRLQDLGFLVTVVPTQASLNFVGKATWEALSGRPVATSVWENADSVSHVALADSCDLIVVAPATADVMARIAQGRADDLLTTTVLASASPKVIVPAMHPHMWLNPATQDNVTTLRARGFVVLEPDVGRLTGKDSGIGRFPETATILEAIQKISQTKPTLQGKKIVVSAGGTREAIDPVRFIGNRSSGRQGLAIAYEALRAGADVTVVSAATDPYHLEGAQVIHVESAEEMQRAIEAEFVDADALVMAAAVADFRMEKSAISKLKKESFSNLHLIRNDDIVASVGLKKRSNQVVVAFAAETSTHLEELGEKKLRAKNADFLYINDVSGGAVFGEEMSSGLLLSMDGAPRVFENVSKYEVAQGIVEAISHRLGTHG